MNADEVQTDWEQLISQWKASKIVYRGAIGFSAQRPLECALLYEFIKKHPEKSEELFTKGLTFDDKQVVGYCLVGLELIKSATLNNLPNSLIIREDEIIWQVGHLRSRDKLGEYALMLSSNNNSNSIRKRTFAEQHIGKYIKELKCRQAKERNNSSLFKKIANWFKQV